MRLSEILPKLQEWFEPEAHKERDLPGGSNTWFYVPWQLIRDRLNEVCPDDWNVTYDDPRYLDKYCYVTCTLTICGVTRQAIGSAQIELISSKGKDMSRGNPIERAVADSFKNSCELFGIAAYLDEQTANREKFARYMHKHGNSKPATQLQNERGTVSRSATPNPAPKPFGQSAKPARQVTPSPAPTTTASSIISQAQVQRFWTIARGKGYSDVAVRLLIEAHGFSSSKEITVNAYETVCRKAEDPEYAEMYNSKAEQFEQQMALSEPSF